jgi:hypothetical protein
MKAGSYSALNSASTFFEGVEFFVRRSSFVAAAHPLAGELQVLGLCVEYMVSSDMSKSFASIGALLSALLFDVDVSMHVME